MKISYNWLKWYIPDVPQPEKLEEIFTFHLAEVESMEKRGDDTIFDINILPNRAHDLLSHQGIARELSGLLGITLVSPEEKYQVPESKPTKLEIDVQTDACRRYMGRIVRNITVGSSPDWVVQHLESIGQRSINNIVDATNMVMFDCGQPCHAFDLDKLASEKIIARQAQKGEHIELLPEKVGDMMKARSFELAPDDMVIADDSKALVIAGVKGGLDAEITKETKNILLEVANFDPVHVRKSSGMYRIKTESSKRFENDLSPELCDWAMLELSATIVEVCPHAEFEEVVDVYQKKQNRNDVSFTCGGVSRLLGMEVSADRVEEIFKNYCFKYERSGEDFTLHVHPLRLDIEGIHDIAEEISRVIGYDHVDPQLPKIDFKPQVHSTWAKIGAVRRHLIADGYREVMTYTFQDKGDVEVAYSAEGKQGLRKNLKKGLEEAYEKNRLNAPLLGLDPKEVKIFEIGNVFTKNGEEIHVGTADQGGVNEYTLDDFIEKKTPKIGEYSFSKTEHDHFKPWSQYPFITRDIAVWVPDGTDPNDLVSMYQDEGGELLVAGPTPFDQFSKDGRTSYAYRMVFQSFDRTLTDTEVNDIMNRITKNVQEKGWEVR